VSDRRSDQLRVWQSFARALGAELRETDSIRGASGLNHPLQALCVDDKSKRLILFSNEPDPRVAALVQGDIQSTLPDVKVLVARPTVYDLAAFVRNFYADAPSAIFSFTDFKQFTDKFNALPKEDQQAQVLKGNFEIIGRMAKAIEHVPMPALTHIGNLVQQATLVNWPQVIEALKKSSEEGTAAGTIDLSRLYEFDSSSVDRAYGVCPLPLYQFTENDWELFAQGLRIEDARERLKALNIYQYFFPAPDQLALGVAERGITKREEITEIVRSAPREGHPFGPMELLPTSGDIKNIIDQLAENSFVSEIDHVVKVTNDGAMTRTKIKATPREGAVSKLINRFRFNVRLSTKDIWPR
jgi:hypothetical protein